MSAVSIPLTIVIDTVPPELNLTTSVTAAPLKNNARLVGTVVDTGSHIAVVSYRFNNQAEIPVAVNSAGSFDQPLNFTGITNGVYTLAVTATDIAGNTTTTPFSITVALDDETPVIGVELLRDTTAGGTTNQDLITFDPTIRGSVTDANQIVSFRAGFNNTPLSNFVEVTAQRQADGSFTLNRPQLEAVYGAALPDGTHTLQLQAQDEFGNTSDVFGFTFTLDTQPDAATLDLDPDSDAAPLGNQKTTAETVKLVGQTIAHTQVELVGTGIVATADATGRFALIGVPLNPGSNLFTVRTTDLAGNQTTFTKTISRVLLDDFTLQEASTLFQRQVTKTLTNLSQPSKLTFTFDAAFDTIDQTSMKDAFEVALVDANGESLVLPISLQRDAFFNLTEGQNAALGAATRQNGQTVTLDLPALPIGKQATLVFRLVNNDQDANTRVNVRDVILESRVNTPEASAALSEPNYAARAISFAQLTDVSPSLVAQYSRTSFNADNTVLYSGVSFRNQGTYAVQGTLLAVVKNLSDPSVKVLDADGVTPDGLAYYDVTSLITQGGLAPGQQSQTRDFAFHNPNGVKFTYEIQLLSQVNREPVIQSVSKQEGIVGKSYTYQVQATDPEGDALTYAISSGPQGMSIDATGKITWTPTSADRAVKAF